MHPSVAHLLKFFEYGDLPPHLQGIVAPFHALAVDLAEELPPNNPEVTVCLRKLLESKDAAVRSML